MSRLQTWDDQVRNEKAKPVTPAKPVAVPTDPALMDLLERIAVASERTLRRVAIIELVMVLPIAIPMIYGLLILWGIRP